MVRRIFEKESTMLTTEKQRDEFEQLARPLMKWINDNFHPHASIIVTNDRAEVVEGFVAFTTNEYVPD